MQVHVGHWWIMDDRGHGIAHRVAAIIPNLTEPNPVINYDFTGWIPLCACVLTSSTPRSEAVALFSTPAPHPDQPRCSTCEVMSPALDRWLTTTGAAR